MGENGKRKRATERKRKVEQDIERKETVGEREGNGRKGKRGKGQLWKGGKKGWKGKWEKNRRGKQRHAGS